MTGIKGRRWGADIYLDSSIDVGAIPYKGANGKLLWLTPGAASQVLTSNGLTPNIPSYQAGGGGGGGGGSLVLLESHTASNSASLDFTSRNASGQSGATIQSDYDDYLLRFLNVVPAANGAQLLCRVSTNGGTSYVSAGGSYMWSGDFVVSGASALQGTGSATAIVICQAISSTVSDGGAIGQMDLARPLDTTVQKLTASKMCCRSTGNGLQISTQESTGVYLATTAYNAFQFLMSSGNITSGTVRVYGLAK